MARKTHSRAGLLLGSAGLALAASLVAAPDKAQAQAFQANPTIVQGTVNIDRATAGQDLITVSTATAVIDWTPNEDNLGNALDFLPTGNIATFQDAPGQGGFAVLNRILPATNGNIAVFDGTVISRLQTASGSFTPGGFVAFYSPTGILVGSNAVFDVGQLLLTTQNPDLTSFNNFATAGGTLNLLTAPSATSRIQIDPGASITSSGEGGFFITAAPQIIQGGTVNINGSVAYIASEETNITYSNGLFDIVIPTGTGVSQAIVHTGTTTGPASTGAGDNHVIYGVAQNGVISNPIQMLFQGNLGFQPAASASVVNGEIILAANYNVFGRTVDNTEVFTGGFYTNGSETSSNQADILISDITVDSRLAAIGTHTVSIQAQNANSTFTGDVEIAAKSLAEMTASNGNTLTINGNAAAFADISGDFDFSSANIDAQGGNAQIIARAGSTIQINGNANVRARGLAGFDISTGTIGNATGGTAVIGVEGGSLNITGDAKLDAQASATQRADNQFAGTLTGGVVNLFANSGGQIQIGGNALLEASAIAPNLDAASSQGGVSVAAGFALVELLDGSNASIAIEGDLRADAFASGGDGNSAGAVGQQARGGFAEIEINGPGNVSVGGTTRLSAAAIGGSNSGSGDGMVATGGDANIVINGGGSGQFAGQVSTFSNAIGGSGGVGGTGGLATGGAAGLLAFNGTMTLGANFNSDASADGGDGANGGEGRGGIAGILAEAGTVDVAGDAAAVAFGVGGNASIGFGGNGGVGSGGLSFLQAGVTTAEEGRLLIGGTAYVESTGIGGAGGAGDSASGIAAGTGGEGRGGVITENNAFNSTFTNGAYIVAQADRGFLSIGGNSIVHSLGIGGAGGNDTTGQSAGVGGNGTGGTAQVGSFIGNGDGSVGQNVINLADVTILANGSGGSGGLGADGTIAGVGGDGTGTGAFFTVRAGQANAGNILFDADGFGGIGTTGGAGTGGTASTIVQFGGSATFASLDSSASGLGGEGLSGDGGAGIGGFSTLNNEDGTVSVSGDATFDASGQGGQSTGGNGGLGTGGVAAIINLTGAVSNSTISGPAQFIAHGTGGDVLGGGGTGGGGVGGNAGINLSGGASASFGSVQAVTTGRGGNSADGDGGTGTGGDAELLATGAGTTVTILQSPFATGGFAPDSFGATIGSYGVGGNTGGGSGVGASGTGGIARISVTDGASVTMPSQPDGGAVRVLARGLGGNTSVDGGTGGFGLGGLVDILVDNSTLNVSHFQPSTFSQGGQVTGANGTGGSARGGDRIIRILNNSTFTSESAFGGGSGAAGANGTGSGNGGNADGGLASLVIDNSTANITGQFFVFTGALGGAGQIGGNATSGTSNVSIVNGSTVTFTPDANGNAGLGVDVAGAIGGDGIAQGGTATGGIGTFDISNSTFTGDLSLGSTTQGGRGEVGNGGSATGGTGTITIGDGAQVTSDTIFLFSNAAGGATAGGTAGSAFAGSVNMTIAQTAMVSVGNLTVQANAIGGALSEEDDDETGGDANGGNATITVNGGNLAVTGDLNMSATGAGSGDAAALGGGAGRGGSAGITLNGGSFSANTASIATDGIGGIAGPSGTGGSANGGNAFLRVNDGSANIVGDVRISSDATGGAGGIGGSANGSFANIGIRQGNLAIGGLTQITADAIGGAALAGTSGAGGNAAGGRAEIFVQAAFDPLLASMTFADIAISANATGGAGGSGDASAGTPPATAGNGGAATAGGVFLISRTNDSKIEFGSANLEAKAIGGSGGAGAAGQIGGAGGNASSGVVQLGYSFFIERNGEDLPTDLNTGTITGGSAFLDISASGGAGGEGAEGAGNGGSVSGTGLTGLGTNVGGGFNIGSLDIRANMVGGDGGIGGQASQAQTIVLARGNSAQIGQIDIETSATGGLGADGTRALATGNTTGLDVGRNVVDTDDPTRGNLNVGTLNISSTIVGGEGSQAGRVTIDAVSGDVNLGTSTITMSGGQPGDQETFAANADNGAIRIGQSFTVDTVGNVWLQTGNGGFIGGGTPDQPAGTLSFSTPSTITILGDNDEPSVGGATLSLSSSELDITEGARIFANTLNMRSTDAEDRTVIGGDNEEEGYTLTQAEAERIDAGAVNFEALGAVLFRDLTIIGSLDDGVSSVALEAGGDITVEGVVQYIDAGQQDRLSIRTSGNLSVVTPGGIGIVGPDDNPTGFLDLAANDLWVADAETLALLAQDPNFEGRDDRLASVAAGSDDPLGYIRGGAVSLSVGNSLFVRNTGTEDDPGGILIGSGGLRIAPTSSGPVTVTAFGRRQNPDGSFTTGRSFFELIQFGFEQEDSRDAFADGSTVNDCDIKTRVCEGAIPEEAPPVNSPTVVTAPVTPPGAATPVESGEEDIDVTFGESFPTLLNTPLLTVDPLIDDPVTSGGDAALYALAEDPEDEDDDDEDEDESGEE